MCRSDRGAPVVCGVGAARHRLGRSSRVHGPWLRGIHARRDQRWRRDTRDLRSGPGPWQRRGPWSWSTTRGWPGSWGTSGNCPRPRQFGKRAHRRRLRHIQCRASLATRRRPAGIDIQGGGRSIVPEYQHIANAQWRRQGFKCPAVQLRSALRQVLHHPPAILQEDLALPQRHGHRWQDKVTFRPATQHKRSLRRYCRNVQEAIPERVAHSYLKTHACIINERQAFR
jgi:hypothetical protein